MVGGEEGDGHDDLCRLRVERERRWAVGCVLVEERGSGRERGTVSDGGAMELGVRVDVWVCVGVGVRGDTSRRRRGKCVERGGGRWKGWRGSHVRRQHIQSSAGERRTMTLWITRFALLAGMAVVAACWVDILTFLVCGGYCFLSSDGGGVA